MGQISSDVTRFIRSSWLRNEESEIKSWSVTYSYLSMQYERGNTIIGKMITFFFRNKCKILFVDKY